MRIVAGDHRGRVLKVLTGTEIRPTSDKVRQAIFNTLQHRGAVDGAVVLDAFCGTGALALEAYSQGAKTCIFMDTSSSSLQLAQENAALLKAISVSTFLLKDASRPGLRPDKIDRATLVFLDPPYRRNLAPQALAALQENGWVADNAFAIVETEKEASLANIPGEIVFERVYRDTRVTVFLI